MTTVLIVPAAILTVVWIVSHFVLNGLLRKEPFLQADADVSPPDPAPMVSVIIPARNEARNIGRSLAAMLDQDYPRFEVIVVDDRSTDDTARIVHDIAGTDTRVKLRQNHELPSEWVGKSYVLQQGSVHACGEILFFLDADVALDPGALRVMVSHLVENRLDLLTMILRAEDESCCGAVCLVVASILLFRFQLHRVNDPESDRVFANGQNIMIRTDVYRDINGHEEVKSVVQEDIALARILKKRGLRPNAVYGLDMGSARWYRSLGSAWRGWTRIVYGLFEGRLSEMVYGILRLLVTCLPLPIFVCAVAMLAVNGATPEGLVLLLLSTIPLVLSHWLLIRLCRRGRSSIVYAVLAFPACLFALGVFVSCIAMHLSSKSVVWRGKRYEMRASM